MKLKPHKHFTTGQPCNCTWAKHTVPEWEDHHASSSSTSTMYHISPARNRESILANGLRVWDGPSPYLWLLADPTVAHEKAGQTWGGSRDNDVWAVDTNGIELQPDPHPGFSDPHHKANSFISTVPIPPERVSIHSPMHQASVPSIDELTPHRYDRECYEVAGSIAQKYPHLKQDAGFYVHPERGAGDHGWNIAPDGTIVDMTAAQHDYNGPEDEPEDDGPIAQPKHPEIVTPDMPEYSRYVSWRTA
jgi:hypothetical protein